MTTFDPSTDSETTGSGSGFRYWIQLIVSGIWVTMWEGFPSFAFFR